MAGEVNSYESACSFLYSFVDYERFNKWAYDDSNFDLGRVYRFFSLIGNPQSNCGWFVHVAGTNGKGSVCAMIANILIKSGYTTGLYTSPHLVSFRERIRVNGEMIPERSVVESVNRMKPYAGETLSFFDVWTGLAFDYFAHYPVEASVIEVGMGGRLDTTNVIIPDVTVITSISLDHVGKLGNNIGEIASEKAGIIKESIPVVSSNQSLDAIYSIEKKAGELNAPLYICGRDFSFERFIRKDGSLAINYRGIYCNIEDVAVPLNGAVQLENAACAIAASEILAKGGKKISGDSIRAGIEKVKWPGRFQLLHAGPDLFVDGACNISAARELSEFLSGKRRKEDIIAVIAMCADKDAEGVIGEISKAAGKIIFTQANTPRAVSAVELARKVSEGILTEICENPVAAVEKALADAGEKGLVIATGSLYLVGDIIKSGYADIMETI